MSPRAEGVDRIEQLAGVGLDRPGSADQGRGARAPRRRNRPHPRPSGRVDGNRRRRRCRDPAASSGGSTRWSLSATSTPTTATGSDVPVATDSTEDVTALRSQFHSFLENAPKPTGLRNYGPTPTAADVEPGRAWHKYLAEHGYVCLHWPAEYGGADASVAYPGDLRRGVRARRGPAPARYHRASTSSARS